MDLIQTWERQLEYLESQAKGLKVLIESAKSFNPIDGGESIVSKISTKPVFKNLDKHPVEYVKDILSNKLLKWADVQSLYSNQTGDKKTNIYKLLKDNQPDVFSTIRFNGNNLNVFFTLTSNVEDNKFNESLRPQNIPNYMKYEVNPIDVRVKNKSK